jgi:hypothetical protein
MKMHLVRPIKYRGKSYMAENQQKQSKSIMAQIRNNLVAIISLIAAVGGFTFDTWRDHQNEINQNMRDAAFEVLQDLGELQTIVNYAHYDADASRGNPIDGWKHAVQVRDLSHLLSADSKKHGQQLYDAWEAHWPKLKNESASEKLISDQIVMMRRTVIKNIDQLN